MIYSGAFFDFHNNSNWDNDNIVASTVKALNWRVFAKEFSLAHNFRERAIYTPRALLS